MSLYSTVVLHLQKKLEKLQNKSNDKQLYLPSSSGIINRQKAHKYGKVQEIGTKLKGRGLGFYPYSTQQTGFQKITAPGTVKKNLYKMNPALPPPKLFS